MINQGVEILVKDGDSTVYYVWTNDKDDGKEKYQKAIDSLLHHPTRKIYCSIDGIPVFHNFLDFLEMVY